MTFFMIKSTKKLFQKCERQQGIHSHDLQYLTVRNSSTGAMI